MSGKLPDQTIQHKLKIEMPFSRAKDCCFGIYYNELTMHSIEYIESHWNIQLAIAARHNLEIIHTIMYFVPHA